MPAPISASIRRCRRTTAPNPTRSWPTPARSIRSPAAPRILARQRLTAGVDSGPDTTPSDAPAADATSDALVSDATADVSDAALEAAADATPDTRPGGDPIGGADKFTLAMALAGFPAGSGVLTAVITTERGQIVCKLDDAHAPVSVANFVGLARGTRPAQRSSSEWTYTKFYDGLLWHRVVADFVIQGGDPDGTGGGGPGYDLPVENQVVEPEGTLAMAAAAVPSGSQFYIVTDMGPAAKYNVFGTCTTDVAKLVKQRDHMQKIEIARCPK